MRSQHQVVLHNSTSTSQNRHWDVIWKLRLPPKIKNFTWRLFKKALHVLANIRVRHIVEESLCPICGCAKETTIHVFRDCHFARIMWARSRIPNMLLLTDVHDV